jgi:hypothetical protein
MASCVVEILELYVDYWLNRNTKTHIRAMIINSYNKVVQYDNPCETSLLDTIDAGNYSVTARMVGASNYVVY